MVGAARRGVVKRTSVDKIASRTWRRMRVPPDVVPNVVFGSAPERFSRMIRRRRPRGGLFLHGRTVQPTCEVGLVHGLGQGFLVLHLALRDQLREGLVEAL